MNITRVFEFDAGHRVLGHGGKCRFPHGHRYRMHLTLAFPDLDDLGMVMDFAQIKGRMGRYIDQELDHAFVVNATDHELIAALDSLTHKSVKVLPFNPTAENLSRWLFENAVGMFPEVTVARVRLYETPNCWADCIA